MPPIYSSDDSDVDFVPHKKWIGHERSMHEVLGGGRVADLLLWRNINVSAALLAGTTLIWFMFEVVEYNFVTLVCHTSITAMLVMFIWRTVAEIFHREPPNIPKLILEGSMFNEIARTFHARFNQFLAKLLDIACGRDVVLFALAIFVLYILSVIGSCFSFLNLLYLGFLCMQTLPFLYDRYEEEVDHLVGRMAREVKRLYRRFDKQFLNKIPRGPVKEKKTK
ncbi:reticulon-like protein B9 isoform X4 [Punica granatum]|uniref:Reticulon-like protein n=1 Tax=Punica granatum TaxID=22663 RepID=A0A6P8BRY4_PUNGR|nr:reticulon-like protein B9 isoform X4 [Punica granatum]